ncbi:hypothetical protein [Lactobacillus sp. B4007]|uniref:hypothetical protein n=1 Tax=Lactobacillus sp. B4007 TaxID=2818032 RepID=UPI00226AE043|nr:hypothetical protein [Lactobacillus sp. B4007]MCX8724857.1 hypothetical protein [Lactobacillus sp. B4007]
MNDKKFSKLRVLMDFFKKQAPTVTVKENITSIDNYKAESVEDYNRARAYLGENNNSFKSLTVCVNSGKDFLNLLNLLGAIHANFNISSKPFIAESDIDEDDDSETIKRSKTYKDFEDYDNNWMYSFENYVFKIVNFDETALEHDQYYI